MYISFTKICEYDTNSGPENLKISAGQNNINKIKEDQFHEILFNKKKGKFHEISFHQRFHKFLAWKFFEFSDLQ